MNLRDADGAAFEIGATVRHVDTGRDFFVCGFDNGAEKQCVCGECEKDETPTFNVKASDVQLVSPRPAAKASVDAGLAAAIARSKTAGFQVQTGVRAGDDTVIWGS
jgi:hypothetical protein